MTVMFQPSTACLLTPMLRQPSGPCKFPKEAPERLAYPDDTKAKGPKQTQGSPEIYSPWRRPNKQFGSPWPQRNGFYYPFLLPLTEAFHSGVYL